MAVLSTEPAASAFHLVFGNPRRCSLIPRGLSQVLLSLFVISDLAAERGLYIRLPSDREATSAPSSLLLQGLLWKGKRWRAADVWEGVLEVL